ncbi:STAS domain-containing protein [Bacillus sp. BGMRC 2118]|nr:STAS domain-containing protein [Bacillus sp. BGMRC 2118]
MDKLQYIENQSFKEFLYSNQDVFDRVLHDRTQYIFLQVKNSSIEEKSIFEIAKKIVHFIDSDSESQLINLAREQGMIWAKSELQSMVKLEYLHELRSLYWELLQQYFKNVTIDIDVFFTLEKKTNHFIDTYLKTYIASYNDYRNKLFQTQREVIEELSVPIIPLTDSTAILPIVGTMDTSRAKRLQEKALIEIEKQKFQRIIIDLSGVAYMDTAVVSHLFKIVDGFMLLGCVAIVTGIRSEVANTMIELGVSIAERVKTKANLQQAIEELQLI